MPTLVMDLRNGKWYIFKGFVEKEITNVTYKQTVTHARTLSLIDKDQPYHYIPINMVQFSAE